MRLAAELDREHVQMVMRVHEQRAAGGLAAAAGAGGVAVVSWPAPDRADLGGWAGGDAYAGRVSGASEAAMRLLAEIVSDRLHGPHLLYEAWVAGRVCDGDLRELIPGTWLYVDWPERIIGTGKWVRLFRAAGFFAIPYGLARPAGAVTLYRGASAGRRAGMSWTTDPGRADQFRQRHSWQCADGGLPGGGHPGGGTGAAGAQRRRPAGGSGRSSDAHAYRAGHPAAPAALPPGCLTADVACPLTDAQGRVR